MVLNCLLMIIGVGLLGFLSNSGVRYFGCFLVSGGANANNPLCMTYQANNIVGQWRRAFCSATMIAMGGIGGIVASLTFRDQDAPGYR